MRLKSCRSLLVYGTVALDSIRTPSGHADRILGGSAVYFSLAARFFCPVCIVGVVGTDFPSHHLDFLRRLGIGTQGIVSQKGKTFFWKGAYTGDMNQAMTLKTELNVLAKFRPNLSASQRRCPYLFLANIDPVSQLSTLRQMDKPKWIACDTMNYWIENSRRDLLKVLKRVDISLMNDAEIKQLSGYDNTLKAARWLLRHGPKMIVIKKGEHGALCVWRHRVFVYPAFLLNEVTDPTGAGDSFAGAFLGYLSRYNRFHEAQIKHALAYATIVASCNVESFGVKRLANLSRKNISDRYAQYRRMISIG